jgi:hypothetical protein
MNKTSKSAVMLPGEQERRQIFYWLKQVSSWTAWNRILSYYKSWKEISEASAREASKRGWENRSGIPESDYRLILKGFAHFDEGVRRLRIGDKRVFKYDANGEFVMAERPEDHWSTMLWRLDLGESEIDYDRTPYWQEFKRILTELNQAWGECSLVIIETDDPTDPATNVYGDWLINQLSKMTFPAQLGDVPDPFDDIFIKTGSTIPCSGIWEPVEVPPPKGFNLFSSPVKPKGPFAITGCMNYLHGGSPAPQALQTKIGGGGLKESVIWRLLWKDERYTNGLIPPEEADYVFLMPEPPAEADSHLERSPELRLVYADSGDPAPQGGRWLVEHDIHASINIQKGEPLPRHQGESVRWVLADTWQ